jgi:hypothetical protein
MSAHSLADFLPFDRALVKSGDTVCVSAQFDGWAGVTAYVLIALEATKSASLIEINHSALIGYLPRAIKAGDLVYIRGSVISPVSRMTVLAVAAPFAWCQTAAGRAGSIFDLDTLLPYPPTEYPSRG